MDEDSDPSASTMPSWRCFGSDCMTAGAPGKASIGDALDRLHRKGMISNPVGKAKSAVFTEESRREAERLFRALFAPR